MSPRFAPLRPASLRSRLNKAAFSMTTCAAFALAAAPFASAQAPAAAPASTGIQLPDHVPALVGSSALLGPVMSAQPIPLALILPLRDSQDLDFLLHDLYAANSPLHGQFLTPQQFTDRFGPTQADYDAVVQYAQSKGLTVTGTNPSRTIVDVSADAATVQQAFNVHLLRYEDPTGRAFYAPDADPTVASSLAGVLSGVVGLDDAAVIQPSGGIAPAASPSGGTGQLGYLAPSDIKTAYNLNGLSVNGAGQTLAVLELDGYNQSDITAYESTYGLPNVPLQNVLVDGYSGGVIVNDPNDLAEVSADIELQIALAPGASRILVYEAQNTYTALLDEYSRIANDDLATEISTSWGGPDSTRPSYLIDGENYAFRQMAAQGQTIYAASGDDGAYDNGSNNGLMTHDPASQPFVCGVGGTQLNTNGPGGAWLSETAWEGGNSEYDTTHNLGGSGGGISGDWPIPFYQSQPDIGSFQAGNSVAYRNVPDVSLNATNNQPYSIYFNGGWNGFYGTSNAAPLWAAFTALVNQKRAANGYSPLGLANPYIYQIGLYVSGTYGNDFHDIATGNNLYYNAVPGYDDATGWGSFNGANLLADLAATPGVHPSTRPFYRLYTPANSGYLYTLDAGAWRSSIENGGKYQGVQCHVFYYSQDAAGLTPFYWSSSPKTGDNLYTIYAAEYQNSLNNGNTGHGVAAYVFPTANPPSGSVPLYRTFTPSNGQHFYTTSVSEYNNSVSNGGTADGVVAYVLP